MAVGTVKNGYAGASYAYQNTTTSAEEFNFFHSSASDRTDEKNDSHVIGLTTLPYGSTNERYGLKAQYAAESTPEQPVIQVTSNYGGQWVSYKVNVNEVDPRNATQLEMFALLSYADDQGISDGGAFGSYHHMRAYAENAQMNGYWEGNADYDSFVNEKQNWNSLMAKMLQDYSQAGVYSQFLNCQKLESVCSYFSVRHVDFENTEWQDKSADVFFRYEFPDVPQEVTKAWFEAAEEAGIDGIGMNEGGMLTHISSMMVQRIKKWMNENESGNVSEISIEAALSAAREALHDLEYPLTPDIARTPEVQKELAKEKEFYQLFIDKLERERQKNGETDATEEASQTAEKQEESDVEEEKTTETDYIQIIREKIQELLTKIQNGDLEPTFQIGSQTFTVKEWNEFLKKFDSLEAAIKQLIKEEIEKRLKEAMAEAMAEAVAETNAETNTETVVSEQQAASTKTAADTDQAADTEETKDTEDTEGISALVSEFTKCTYPASDPEKEDIMYIVWYTEEGIFCRKAGQSTGYEWSILFEDSDDYDKVMALLDRFDRDGNLRFTAHQNFWEDFLNDELDTEGFIEFFEGTDNGIPNYAITVGDSTYIDKDKAQWAKYMNPFGARFYTEEEMYHMWF